MLSDKPVIAWANVPKSNRKPVNGEPVWLYIGDKKIKFKDFKYKDHLIEVQRDSNYIFYLLSFSCVLPG